MSSEQNNKNPTHDRDLFWRSILEGIRSTHQLFSPVVSNLCKSPTCVGDRSALVQYEYLLSQIDDSLELAQPISDIRGTLSETNLSQVAEDFGEAYARRFSHAAAERVAVCVDSNLPRVKAHPETIYRILDCLVRSAQRGEVSNQADYKQVVLEMRSVDADPGYCRMILVCRGVIAAAQAINLGQDVKAFRHGFNAEASARYGIELCAAMHLALQLGATVMVDAPDSAEPALVFEFDFEKVTLSSEETGKGGAIPEMFLFCSQSKALRDSLRLVGDFHHMRCEPVESVASLRPGKWLLFDAAEYAQNGFREYDMAINPRETILILKSGDLAQRHYLSHRGFRHFMTSPIVSSRLLRAFNGGDEYCAVDRAQPEEGKTPLRVLVVDDTETTRILLREQLESRGHFVSEATDGSELVRRIKDGERYDIIFCDIVMSGMNGIVAVDAMREVQKQRGECTPVAFMTAYAALSEGRAHDDKTRQSVLRKPIDPNQIDDLLLKLALQPQNGSTSAVTEIIDIDDLRNRCGGKAKTMIRVLESFIEAAYGCLPKLRSTAIQSDIGAMSRMVHTLKGLLRDAGAKDRESTIDRIESKLHAAQQLVDNDIYCLEGLIQSACRSAVAVKGVLHNEPR